MSVRKIPEGFNTVSAFLVVPNAAEAITFYKKAFGAEAGVRLTGPDGDSTMHAEFQIGDSTVMISDENPEMGTKSPASYGGSAASLHLYVDDADAVYGRALEAGCEVRMPIDDAFWGDRYGQVKDPYGYSWGIATHQEDLSPEEIGERAAKFFSEMS